ncbi:MAG: glycosyltransferase [Planctomycetaceae bacterium]|nr:glycosyltransferase [Planctomycetaceae bacterium]
MPNVSILIPCYNAERWVAQAIQSALDQTHDYKEVIVVDDGSTDGSLEIIKSFGDKIRWETGPNRGGNVARNRLLELAIGEWLQYLDADDYLRPEKIERQLDQIADDVDVVYSAPLIETWNENGIVDSTIGNLDSDAPIELQWIRWQVAQTGTVLWKSTSLKQIGGWNKNYPCCQDNEVTLRAIQQGLVFKAVSHADAIYRIWSEETVCRKDPSRVIHTKTKLIDEMLNWLQDNGNLKKETKQAAGQASFEMARTLAQHDMQAAVGYFSDRQSRGLIKPAGAASSFAYRFVLQFAGFRSAEFTARVTRNFRGQ